MLHFVPVIVWIVIRLVVLGYDMRQDGFEDVQNGYLMIHLKWKYLDPIVTLFSIAQMTIYLVLSFQLLTRYRSRIQHYFSNIYAIELNWLRIFLIIYIFLFAYHSIQVVVNAIVVDLNWIQEWWYYLLSGIAIIYVGIKGYFTDLTTVQNAEVQSFLDSDASDPQISAFAAQHDQGLLSEKIQSQKAAIETYFSEHQPYLDPNLNLVRLAQKLGMRREELSETINKGFDSKFNDFINHHRVEAFKEKVAQGQHQRLSILGVAFDCGFNSKATFNRSFKKIMGISPSEYLKSI